MHLHRSRMTCRSVLIVIGSLLCGCAIPIASVSCTRADTAQEGSSDGSAGGDAGNGGDQTAATSTPPATGTAGAAEESSRTSTETVSPTAAGGYTQAELDASVSAECRAALDEIEEVRKRVPITFGHVGRKVEDILADMERCTQLCRRYMDECPGPMADALVSQIIARFLLAGSQSYVRGLIEGGMPVDEAQAALEERFAEARTLTELALATNKVGEPYHVRASRLLIDLLSQTATAEETEKALDRLLADYPDYKDHARLCVLVAQTYIQQLKYKEAVRFIDAVIEKHESDPEYPLYNEKLFEGLTGTGDLRRLEELQHIIRSEYSRRMSEFKGDGLIQARQSLDTATFWLGLIKYAQGDAQSALDYFLESKEHLERKLAEAVAAKKRPDPVLHIYLEYRTKDYIKFLNEFHGRVPELDLDLGDMWVTENKLTLEESRGNVVILLSREPGNRRSEIFLQEMDKLVKEKWDEGLRGVVVAYLAGTITPEKREELQQMMRDDHARLGVTLPAGYDPDTKRQSFLRGIHATVGPSATFLVFNRRGEQAWYHFDPRPVDVGLAKSAVLRILEEE